MTRCGQSGASAWIAWETGRVPDGLSINAQAKTARCIRSETGKPLYGGTWSERTDRRRCLKSAHKRFGGNAEHGGRAQGSASAWRTGSRSRGRSVRCRRSPAGAAEVGQVNSFWQSGKTDILRVDDLTRNHGEALAVHLSQIRPMTRRVLGQMGSRFDSCPLHNRGRGLPPRLL